MRCDNHIFRIQVDRTIPQFGCTGRVCHICFCALGVVFIPLAAIALPIRIYLPETVQVGDFDMRELDIPDWLYMVANHNMPAAVPVMTFAALHWFV